MTPLQQVTAAATEVDRAIEAVEALYKALREVQHLLQATAEKMVQTPVVTGKPRGKG